VVFVGRSSSAMVARVMPCIQLDSYEAPSPRSSVVAMLITATGMARGGAACVRWTWGWGGWGGWPVGVGVLGDVLTVINIEHCDLTLCLGVACAASREEEGEQRVAVLTELIST
jgi:hypothetical protein